MVTRSSRSRRVAAATSPTARSNASALACDGLVEPLSLRTYCSAASCTSASVAGGAKLCSGRMLRHMRPTVARTAEPQRRPGVLPGAPTCGGRRRSADDAHARVELAGPLAGAQHRQPGEPRVESLLGQPPRPILPGQLHRTIRDRPLRLETQLLTRPREINPVRARVVAVLASDQE